MDFVVRPLRVGEIERLVDDLWFPFAEEMAELDPHNALAEDVRGDALAYRDELLEAADTAIWVAEVDDQRSAASNGELAGYVCAYEQEPPPVFARGPSVHVKELYVVPTWRGEGVGTRLLERAHEWGRERGCVRASLSVNVLNESARGLYESQGYEPRRLSMDRDL